MSVSLPREVYMPCFREGRQGRLHDHRLSETEDGWIRERHHQVRLSLLCIATPPLEPVYQKGVFVILYRSTTPTPL